MGEGFAPFSVRTLPPANRRLGSSPNWTRSDPEAAPNRVAGGRQGGHRQASSPSGLSPARPGTCHRGLPIGRCNIERGTGNKTRVPLRVPLSMLPSAPFVNIQGKRAETGTPEASGSGPRADKPRSVRYTGSVDLPWPSSSSGGLPCSLACSPCCAGGAGRSRRRTTERFPVAGAVAARMKAPEGFRVSLFAGEPDVAQADRHDH